MFVARARLSRNFVLTVSNKHRFPIWFSKQLRFNFSPERILWLFLVLCLESYPRFWQQTSFGLVYWSRSVFILLLFSVDTFRCFGNTAVFETGLNRGFWGTRGEDTLVTGVSIRFLNDVFSESAHCLLTARLRGSGVQSLVLLNRGVAKTFAVWLPTA